MAIYLDKPGMENIRQEAIWPILKEQLRSSAQVEKSATRTTLSHALYNYCLW